MRAYENAASDLTYIGKFTVLEDEEIVPAAEFDEFVDERCIEIFDDIYVSLVLSEMNESVVSIVTSLSTILLIESNS